MTTYDWNRAGCLTRPLLPWTADVGTATVEQTARMRAVCRHCPLRLACATLARETQPTAGFWAGHWATGPDDTRPAPALGQMPATQGVIPFPDLTTGAAGGGVVEAA